MLAEWTSAILTLSHFDMSVIEKYIFCRVAAGKLMRVCRIITSPWCAHSRRLAALFCWSAHTGAVPKSVFNCSLCRTLSEMHASGSVTSADFVSGVLCFGYKQSRQQFSFRSAFLPMCTLLIPTLNSPSNFLENEPHFLLVHGANIETIMTLQ